MKDAEYAVSKGDKIQRGLALVLLVSGIGIELSSGVSHFATWRFLWLPPMGAALIWYSDDFATAISGKNYPILKKSKMLITVMGWVMLALPLIFFLIRLFT